MAKNLLHKYVWLVETIYKAKRITFEDINKKWLENDLSEGVELALRTFHKWRIAAEDIFGVSIDCERKGGYHYYIANADELKSGNIRNWLLSTISVSNLLIGNLQLKERILLEEIPSGQEYLANIIEAMKQGYVINMTYHGYVRETGKNFNVEPYCVKLFKQRWYMVARSSHNNKVLTYSLDRIRSLEILTNERFNMPESFSPSELFSEFYGITVGVDCPMEEIKLKVSAYQANYLRSLPLHHSQQEIERTTEYSIFQLSLRPTYDFQQEILKNGEDIEVLEPLWLRNKIADKIKRMWNKYNQKEDL